MGGPDHGTEPESTENLMATRTYGQHCGLAAAMDLVGQRWSMLIVRDLTPGPLRFTDLFEGLPGIATDVLAERLRELQAAGVVEHRTTRSPVSAKVYALTETGRALSDIAAQLADWGRPLLPTPPAEGTVVRARWALQTMARRYAGGLADGVYELVIDDEPLCVEVGDDRAIVRYGPATEPPIVRIGCSAKKFFAAATRPSAIRRRDGDARPSAGYEVDGDLDTAVALFSALPLAVPARS